MGLKIRSTPRQHSFCAARSCQPRPQLMVVPDARADERFRDNPLVTGDPHIRFYAGAPLVTPDGHALGTVCVIDREPREAADEALQAALEALARQVVAQLELRRTVRQLSDTLDHYPRRRGRPRTAGGDRRIVGGRDRQRRSRRQRHQLEPLPPSGCSAGRAAEIVGRPVAAARAAGPGGGGRRRCWRRCGRGSAFERFETVGLTKSGDRVDVALSDLADPRRPRPGGRRGADRPRHLPPAAGRRGAAGRQGGRRGGEPGEEPVSGERQPRAAHAAQRDHRLQRDARARTPPSRATSATCPTCNKIQRRRPAPARADQRRAGPLEDRGRADERCSLETFDVAEMLRGVASTLAPLAARNRNVAGDRLPRRDIGSIRADLTKVRQCLFNLLGQRVQVHGERRRPPVRLARAARAGSEWVLFRVSDTGIGMSPDQIERLFEAFAQAEAIDRPPVRRHGAGADDQPAARPHDGRRRDGVQRTGRGLDVHARAARRPSTTTRPSRPCRPTEQRLRPAGGLPRADGAVRQGAGDRRRPRRAAS